MFATRKSLRFFAPVTVIGAIAALVVVAGQPDAHGQDADESAIQVGTYDAQAVFQQYPGSEELITMFQDAQQQMQEAQQNGDQEAMQRLQQEMETKRQETIDEFQTALDEALPEVADEAGVKVVAVEVIYTADDVGQADLTEQLAQAISD